MRRTGTLCGAVLIGIFACLCARTALANRVASRGPDWTVYCHDPGTGYGRDRMGFPHGYCFAIGNLNDQNGPNWTCRDMSLSSAYFDCTRCDFTRQDFWSDNEDDGHCIPRPGGAASNSGRGSAPNGGAYDIERTQRDVDRAIAALDAQRAYEQRSATEEAAQQAARDRARADAISGVEAAAAAADAGDRAQAPDPFVSGWGGGVNASSVPPSPQDGTGNQSAGGLAGPPPDAPTQTASADGRQGSPAVCRALREMYRLGKAEADDALAARDARAHGYDIETGAVQLWGEEGCAGSITGADAPPG